MELAVLAVVRDESSRLNYFLAQLDRIKKISPFSNLYVSFYENDSADDTPEKIRSWLLDNPGQLQSEILGFERLRGREVTRTQRMVCLAMDLRTHGPRARAGSAWTLVRGTGLMPSTIACFPHSTNLHLLRRCRGSYYCGV